MLKTYPLDLWHLSPLNLKIFCCNHRLLIKGNFKLALVILCNFILCNAHPKKHMLISFRLWCQKFSCRGSDINKPCVNGVKVSSLHVWIIPSAQLWVDRKRCAFSTKSKLNHCWAIFLTSDELLGSFTEQIRMSSMGKTETIWCWLIFIASN